MSLTPCPSCHQPPRIGETSPFPPICGACYTALNSAYILAQLGVPLDFLRSEAKGHFYAWASIRRAQRCGTPLTLLPLFEGEISRIALGFITDATPPEVEQMMRFYAREFFVARTIQKKGLLNLVEDIRHDVTSH